MMAYNASRLFALLCGSLVMLLILAGIVALIIWAARSWSRSGRSVGTYTTGATTEPTPGDRAIPDRALDILRERYARGEITKEQYDQMRRDLT